MLKNQNTNILLLEAKDLIKNNGYKTTSYTKYKGNFDYSLEAIKINELDPNAFYMNGNQQYTNAVISVKFNLTFKNENGKVIADRKALRKKLYKDGFDLDGIHYVRFKRSAGSARQGRCTFVRQDLYKDLMEWSYMDIDHEEGIEMDLAKVETYMSLTTSSIIDTIVIRPENILLIDDVESIFDEKVMATKLINGRLHTAPKVATIKNSIWDGQSLLDSSIFDNNGYSDKGMLLLRNRFFKSACFNTNIQQFFEDNNITSVLQLNGKTVATDIKDIKLITTPSSIKYLGLQGEYKFASYLSQLDPAFGVVKYDKGSHHINDMVSTHYQLINTLQLSKDEVEQLLEQTMDYMHLLKTSLPAFRNHIKITKVNAEARAFDAYNSGRMMYNLLALNDDFAKTKLFKNFRSEIISAYKRNAQEGHILIDGNYSTLCGNAPEMLKFSINKFYIDNTPSELQGKEIHSKAFDYDKDILACRSPHVTMGNILMAQNKDNKFINTYFGKSLYVVHINSIKENVLETLSGADFDSDTVLLTDNELLVRKAKLNYGKFLVPNDFTGKSKIKRHNTVEDKADLDIKTSNSQNMIGKIINLSQLLNSEYWDRTSRGEDVDGLYELICALDVMSCICIDSAKKESPVNLAKELEAIKNSKWLTKGSKPKFFEYTRKKYYKTNSDGEKEEVEDKTIYIAKETPMDYLEEILDSKKRVRFTKKESAIVPLSDLLNKNIDRTKANKKQILAILNRVENDNKTLSNIWLGTDKNDKEAKSDACMEAGYIKEALVNYIKSLKMNKETVATLIYRLSKDYSHGSKGNSLTEYGRLLLTALYEGHKIIFLEALNLGKENITVLEADDAGDIDIYGKKYKVITA
jgi:hypothetical protein